MLQNKIALIDQTGKIQPHHLLHTAQAIQTQINRDLAKFWPGVNGTVTAMLSSDKVPVGTWPVYVVDSLSDGEGGYHWYDRINQPYAEVLGGTGWTVAASHEICEMLVDPWGNRLQEAPQIVVDGRSQSLGTATEAYLVEVCDPCENFGYLVGNVPVSDFITPEYYQAGTSGCRYCYTGAIKAPMQVLAGGYISWTTPQGEMMQLLWLDPHQPPQIVNLGPTGKASLKDFVDSKTGSVKRLSTSQDHPAVRQALAAGFTP